MNAIDLLKQDHRVVDALFQEVESTPPSRHEALFKRINGELTTHAHVEEKIFYPAVKKVGDKELKDYVLESIEEHLQMKMFLGQLDGMSSKKENYEAKLKVLIEDTRHHVKEEENEWFPKAQSKLSSEQLEKLGARMEAEKKRYQQSNGIKPEPREMADGAITKFMNKALDAVTGLVAGSSSGNAATASGRKAAPAKAKAAAAGSSKTSSGSSKSTAAKSTKTATSAKSTKSTTAAKSGSKTASAETAKSTDAGKSSSAKSTATKSTSGKSSTAKTGSASNGSTKRATANGSSKTKSASGSKSSTSTKSASSKTASKAGGSPKRSPART